MLSLLHATRSRPDKSLKTTKRWVEYSGVKTELIVSLDQDDPALKRYLIHYPNAIVNKNRSAVDAVNRAAEQAKGNILVVLSDDTECPPGWGNMIVKATKKTSDFVLKVNDDVQKWIVTQPILDRAYYERFGYVYHPGYLHQFVDTHFTHVADALGKIIFRNDIHFPHRHYSVTRQRPDEINRRADATWDQGKRLYLDMLKRNLDLPDTVDIMKLSHFANDHLRWIRKNAKL